MKTVLPLPSACWKGAREGDKMPKELVFTKGKRDADWEELQVQEKRDKDEKKRQENERRKKTRKRIKGMR